MDYPWSGTTPNTGSGTAALSATAGATATFTFTGTAGSSIGFRGPLAGIASVYVDDALVAQPDLYSPADQVRVPVFASAALAPGSHTLRIEATGQRNAAAIGAYVIVDAFDVTLPSAAPPVSRIEQTAPSIVFTPDTGWSQTVLEQLLQRPDGRPVDRAGCARRDHLHGDVDQVNRPAPARFGNRARLFGSIVRHPGRFVHADPGRVPGRDVHRHRPGPGQHVLSIEVTGEKHPSSSGSMVIVDAFEFSCLNVVRDSD